VAYVDPDRVARHIIAHVKNNAYIASDRIHRLMNDDDRGAIVQTVEALRSGMSDALKLCVPRMSRSGVAIITPQFALPSQSSKLIMEYNDTIDSAE
jgi:hypothetical protein